VAGWCPVCRFRRLRVPPTAGVDASAPSAVPCCCRFKICCCLGRGFATACTQYRAHAVSMPQPRQQAGCMYYHRERPSVSRALLMTPYVLLWVEQPVMLCRVPVTLVQPFACLMVVVVVPSSWYFWPTYSGTRAPCLLFNIREKVRMLPGILRLVGYLSPSIPPCLPERTALQVDGIAMSAALQLLWFGCGVQC
jgi:hypothetical protein